MEEVFIPENKYKITAYKKSAGPGGQNVNKVSTAVELRCDIDELDLTEEEKNRIKEQYPSRIVREDFKEGARQEVHSIMIVRASEERSQKANKERAVEKFLKFITEAIVPEKERLETKPTRSSKEKRLQEKKIQSEKKKERTFDWRKFK
ncbi:MAG: alternative ribosome rescue aminoacyl-tRNA hydrolase ArfB [Patescibacteria group bacterium]|nr:alternative ribosome rescue aminoacyl-tRNA hydrolase ArfB [Patescibacteria group bacterium]MDD5490719.1 alternative ribosome rescue aminoacyl-tRNA hydrolase ArfB [Patescibacteria group bacterium]